MSIINTTWRFSKCVLQRAAADSSVRAAFFVFALTRAIVFAIFVLITNVTPSAPFPAANSDVQERRINISVSLRDLSFARKL